MIKMTDLYRQYLSIQNDIDAAIKSVINETAFISGRFAQRFEKEFAEYLGIKNCIGVGNGTDALEIAIEVLDLPKGSEIIVPANSFIASAEAVTRTGNRVVFCDCNETNYTIDIESLKQKITKHTGAVIAVHLFGHPCDMDEIRQLSDMYGFKVIEDCAQAHGAEYKGKKTGGFGDIATFSFYPGKNLGAYGDAGAIVTSNDVLAEKARKIANHGRIGKYDHEFEGRNSRLDGIQAAILSAKLKYLDIWNKKRRDFAGYYLDNLAGIENIILPVKTPQVKHVYHQFVIRTEKRDELIAYLAEHNIETGIHYPIALPKLKAYEYLHQFSENFSANKNDAYLLSLPIGEHLEEKNLVQIVKTIQAFFEF
jgi:dTDP-4-amino-4,6-dideoxygalactose transaminase